MSHVDVLPDNASRIERAFAAEADIYAKTAVAIASMSGLKLINPPPGWLPFLVYEYGLGELTPYVPNLYDLIREGVAWQRVRGTPAAVSRGLDWLHYAATIEEPPARRERWNLFQLALNRLRDSEDDLLPIEAVTQLSVAMRSVFWRGYRGHDVRALEYGWTRWSGARWSTYSGVRLAPGEAKWSFGRLFDVDHEMTQAELTLLGVWLAPTGDDPGWWDFPWPDTPWLSSAAIARAIAMRESAQGDVAWIEFRDAANAVIGYRRARAYHAVSPAFNGRYGLGASRFEPSSTATRLYVEALTEFGDGFGAAAVRAGVIFEGAPADDHPPGALWLPAGGLDHAHDAVALTDLAIPFGRTVRERLRFLLRF